jgi:hypothetical protein
MIEGNDEESENSEEKLLEKSKKMLESKAKYYQDVIKGKKSTGNRIFRFLN